MAISPIQDADAAQPAWQGIEPKDVPLFVLRLMLWYALFLIPWTGLDQAYGAGFRFAGNAFMSSMGDVSLSYDTGPEHQDMDTLIELREGKTNGSKPTSSRLLGYLPTMLLVALVLATRSSWKLRIRRILIGGAIVSLIGMVRLAIDIYATLAPNPAFRSVSVSDGLKPTLSFVHEIAAFQPSTGFVAAAVVWVVLTLLTEPAPE